MQLERSPLVYWTAEECDVYGVCYHELDEHAHLIEVNQAWLDMAGASRAEVIGYPLSDFVDAGCLDKNEKHFTILKEYGEINVIRFQFQYHGNQFREVILFGRSEYNEQGQFLKTHCWFALSETFYQSDILRQRFLNEVEASQIRLANHSYFLDWIFNSLTNLMVVVCNGQIVRANSAFMRFWRLPRYSCLADFQSDVFASLLDEIQTCSRNGDNQEATIALQRPESGEQHLFECEVTPLNNAHDEQIILLTDVTHNQLVEKSLAQERNLSSQYLQIAKVMIVALDQDGTITLINQKGCETLGYREEELLGQNWFDWALQPSERKRMQSYFFGVLDGAFDDNNETISEVRTRNNESRLLSWRSSVLCDEKGHAVGILASAEDITELHRSHELLKQMAHFDNLTELPNRSHFNHQLTSALHHAKHDATSLAVGFLDLDNFKPVNDMHGHQAGDELLVALARRLQNQVRSTDIIGRFGGDEFVFILQGYDSVEALQNIAQNLLNSIRQPFNIKGQRHTVTISLGLSVYPEDGESAAQLIENADMAMYEAKHKGKNDYYFFDESIRAKQLERYLLQKDLELAVKYHQFEVYYQPQINHQTQQVVGLEALLRWNHPKRGLVMPDTFIPLAEELKLIVPIGEQVLRQACEDIKSLHQSGLFKGYVSVNVSGIQINSEHFLTMVESVLEETEVSPKWLEMEITESVVMTEPDKWISLFKHLKSVGIRLAIDDFGKGYSSLSHLSDLPLDKLKIDMSFVKRLPHDSKARAIAQSIIDLSENMGMTSLAEGVENSEQQDYLTQQNCEIGQGYLFARPMPLAKLKAWLAERNKKAS